MKNILILTLGAILMLSAAIFSGCTKDVEEATVKVESVELSATLKAGVDILVGQTLDVDADVTILPANATNQKRDYKSADITVAMVSAKGIITANGAGTTTITVIAEGKTSAFDVTVISPTPDDVRVESVTIDPTLKDGADLVVEGTLNIADKVTFTPENATYPTKSYSSSDTNIATISIDGTITAKAVGTTTITATVDGRSDTFVLTVTPIRVVSIELDAAIKAGVELNTGKTIEIAGKVTVTPANASDKTEAYSSSDTGVATVSASGKVTAIAAGTSTITMTIDGKSDSFVVTVTDVVEVPTVSIAFTSLDIPVGATNRIWQHITVTPEVASLKEKPIVFSSSNEAVATVDEYGVIITKSAGNAIITVALKDDAQTNATLNVKVVAATYYERKAALGAAADWSLTTINTLVSGQKTDAAFDGAWGDSNSDAAANMFGVSRPKPTSADTPVSFTVDMKEQKVVNVFKIIHRSGPNTNMAVRFFGFDEILGSNDGTNFTTIATNVEVADAISPVKLSISETTFTNATPYQYIKFLITTPAFCFINGWANYPGVDKLLNADRTIATDTSWNNGIISSKSDGAGGSLQLQELYLGHY